MQVYKTELPEVLVIVPRVFEDKRGFFSEIFNKEIARYFIETYKGFTGSSRVIQLIMNNHAINIHRLFAK